MDIILKIELIMAQLIPNLENRSYREIEQIKILSEKIKKENP
jgi:hypothetical protein